MGPMTLETFIMINSPAIGPRKSPGFSQRRKVPELAVRFMDEERFSPINEDLVVLPEESGGIRWLMVDRTNQFNMFNFHAGFQSHGGTRKPLEHPDFTMSVMGIFKPSPMYNSSWGSPMTSWNPPGCFLAAGRIAAHLVLGPQEIFWKSLLWQSLYGGFRKWGYPQQLDSFFHGKFH